MVRRVVLGRSKELATNQRGDDVGVTGSRQISAGATQENYEDFTQIAQSQL